MKTPSMIIIHSCPYCETTHKCDITNFKFDPERNIFHTEKECWNCEVEFYPTIHLNEFKEKEDENTSR